MMTVVLTTWNSTITFFNINFQYISTVYHNGLTLNYHFKIANGYSCKCFSVKFHLLDFPNKGASNKPSKILCSVPKNIFFSKELKHVTFEHAVKQ